MIYDLQVSEKGMSDKLEFVAVDRNNERNDKLKLIGQKKKRGGPN